MVNSRTMEKTPENNLDECKSKNQCKNDSNCAKETDDQKVINKTPEVEKGAVIPKKYLQPNAEKTTDQNSPKATFQDSKIVMDFSKSEKRPLQLKNRTGHKFEFWSSQPVPDMNELHISKCGPIIEQDINSIRKEEYSLPAGFKWDTLQLDDPLHIHELYILLFENYIEDDNSLFRIDYQPSFLKWALQPPGWKKEWYCGVRAEKSEKLIAFISAVPITLRIYETIKQAVEIKFLCVHKKLRSKRLAPVLIREITRRVNMYGIFQAVYAAEVLLPKPIGTCRYYHRSLDPKKLVEIEFSHLSKNMTMQRAIKFYKLPEAPKTPGFRRMTQKDLEQAHSLLSKYLEQFLLAPVFSFEEFKHWFSPQKGVIESFVVTTIKNPKPVSNVIEETNPKKCGKAFINNPIKEKQEVYEEEEITDFISYYTLSSTPKNIRMHKSLKAAFSFYNVSNKTPWVNIMNDALVTARNLNCDVFNALDIMDNKRFIKPCKFGPGDNILNYYLYNWRCSSMFSRNFGLVLQ